MNGEAEVSLVLAVFDVVAAVVAAVVVAAAAAASVGPRRPVEFVGKVAAGTVAAVAAAVVTVAVVLPCH